MNPFFFYHPVLSVLFHHISRSRKWCNSLEVQPNIFVILRVLWINYQKQFLVIQVSAGILCHRSSWKEKEWITSKLFDLLYLPIVGMLCFLLRWFSSFCWSSPLGRLFSFVFLVFFLIFARRQIILRCSPCCRSRGLRVSAIGRDEVLVLYPGLYP